MPDAIKALGEDKVRYFNIHVGPGFHVLHFSVANGAMLNVAAVISDTEE